MKRFHMKKDQSGAALCTASEKACPNGEFGHYDSEYEVLMAYEQAVIEGNVPGLATMAGLKRREILDSREDLEKDLAKATDEASYVDAIAFNIHPLDTAHQQQLISKHSDESFRSVAVRARIASLTNSKVVLENLSEKETNSVVLYAVAENPHLAQVNAEALLSRFTGEKADTLKRFMASWGYDSSETEVKISPINPPKESRSEEVNQPEKSNSKERPIGEIARALVEAYSNFDRNFTELDRSFSSMSSFVNKSSSFSKNMKKELSEVLSSPREYTRALHLGGVGGKPALDRALISFGRIPSLSAQRIIRKMVENQLRRRGLSYDVQWDGERLKISPVNSEELNRLYEVNHSG